MEEPQVVRREPGVWVWILGALVVIGILVGVFAALAHERGPTNETLPGARLPAASSMVAMAIGSA